MNKIKIHSTILLVFTLFLVQITHGQEHAYIQVNVGEGVGLQDSILITVWDNFTHLASDYERREHRIESNDMTSFGLTIYDPTYAMRVKLQNSTIGMPIPFVLVEPGDSVIINIDKLVNEEVIVSFSGKGSAKYRILYETNYKKKDLDVLWLNRNTYESASSLIEDLEALRVAWLSVLDRSRPDLWETAYQILRADLLGYFKYNQLLLISTCYAESTGSRKSDFEDSMLKLLDDKGQPASPDLFALSKDYVHYLYNKEKIGLVYRFNPYFNKYGLGLNAPYSFKVLYNELAVKYNGALCDRLLSYCLVNSSDMIKFFRGVDADEFLSCIDHALESMVTPAMIRLIKDERQTKTKGQQAYDFALPDPNGNTIRLSDLKGKVVLLDFWGYGCGACLAFKQRFESEVYPEFKDNERFVFVSVNTDREKETWLKALPMYSNHDFLNLGLYGLGSKHPMIKHYNIKSWPFLLLLDKSGSIVSSTIPIDSPDLVNLINDQIHKK